MSSLAKIYQLISPNQIYIGSTTNHLQHRLGQHLCAYYNHKNNPSKYRHCSAFKVLDDDSVEIKLIEEFQYTTRNEMLKREQHWIVNTPNCVNKAKACAGVDTNYKEDWNKYHREYYIQNKERNLERKKEYYLKNRDKILQKLKSKKSQEQTPTEEASNLP